MTTVYTVGQEGADYTSADAAENVVGNNDIILISGTWTVSDNSQLIIGEKARLMLKMSVILYAMGIVRLKI